MTPRCSWLQLGGDRQQEGCGKSNDLLDDCFARGLVSWYWVGDVERPATTPLIQLPVLRASGGTVRYVSARLTQALTMPGLSIGVDGPASGPQSLLRPELLAKLPTHLRGGPTVGRVGAPAVPSPSSAGSLLSPVVRQRIAVPPADVRPSALRTDPPAVVADRLGLDALMQEARPLLLRRPDGSLAMVVKGPEGAAVRDQNILPPAARNARGVLYTDVNMHSDARGFAFKAEGNRWVDVSAEQLAGVMARLGWSGQPVRLLACSAGAADGGGAQGLADALKTEVAAPTKTHWRRPAGGPNFVGELRFEAANADGSLTRVSWTPGDWRTFLPGRAPQPNGVLQNPYGLSQAAVAEVGTSDRKVAHSAFINHRLAMSPPPPQPQPEPQRQEAR